MHKLLWVSVPFQILGWVEDRDDSEDDGEDEDRDDSISGGQDDDEGFQILGPARAEVFEK